MPANHKDFFTYLRLRMTRHGYFLYPPADQYVGGCFENYGEYSPVEVAFLQRLCGPEDIVIDAGANFGSLTLPLAQSAGKVYAFEPQFIVRKILEANIRLNDISNVEVYGYALGSSPGTVNIPVLNLNSPGNFGRFGVENWGSGRETIVVPLDDVTDQKISLIKLDVEGMELEALKGGSRMISEHQPLLFVENDRPEHSAELIEHIRSLDYHLRWFISPLYTHNNFYENTSNIFTNHVSFNMFCYPAARSADFDSLGLPEVSPTDSVVSAPLSWVVAEVS